MKNYPACKELRTAILDKQCEFSVSRHKLQCGTISMSYFFLNLLNLHEIFKFLFAFLINQVRTEMSHPLRKRYEKYLHYTEIYNHGTITKVGNRSPN